MLTADHIQKLGYPGMPRPVAERWARSLGAACARFGINTTLRQAHFIAQVMHESVGLRYAEEIASGAAYEGRADLGNTQPGDGIRYKGRGPIQLTGRFNYRLAAKDLGLPLEAQPQLAALPENGALIAGWYWFKRNINQHADLGATSKAVEMVSADVNGRNRQTGMPNGLSDRQARFSAAWSLLNQPATANGRVLLVPSGGGEPVVWNGADKYATLDLVALVPQLRLLHPQPGGPWIYQTIKLWVQQDGDMVLERLPVTPNSIPATPEK